MSEHDIASGSEYYDSGESESEVTRPNRWAGAPSTWQSITQQERDLAGSLDELRNRDLSVHLFNAHALSKRAARLSEDKVDGIKIEDLINEDAGQPFLPPKTWTAWPLPPDEVPRNGETIGEDDPDDIYTFKRRETERPSRELEDVLMGVALRLVKQRFHARDWASEGEHDVDSLEEDDLEYEQRAKDTMEAQNLQKAGSEDAASPDKHPAPKKKRSKSAPPEGVLRPILSADDERSQELLRPTVRHTLSKLDEVLMALHHARTICLRYSSQSEEDTDGETASTAAQSTLAETPKRHPGRPRKYENLPDQAAAYLPPSKEDIDAGILRQRKAARGRKPKQYPRLEGETKEEYHIRVARLQKKPLPPFTPARTATPGLENPSPQRVTPKKATTPRENGDSSKAATMRYKRKLGLRDWSEVLGSAALVGFPPDVITRATKRCADMFGEGMVMRTMIEAPFGPGNAEISTTYCPEEIPDLGPGSETVDEVVDTATQGIEDFDEQRSKGIRRLAPVEHCFCPVKNCRRRTRGFATEMLLRLHLRKQHQMTKEQIADLDIPSDEEMGGAVHIDRFLRSDKRPLRGKDKKERKKRKRGGRRSTPASDDEQEAVLTSSDINRESQDE